MCFFTFLWLKNFLKLIANPFLTNPFLFVLLKVWYLYVFTFSTVFSKTTLFANGKLSNSIVEEQTALTELKNNQSIIIRLFDKCGCIFIMNARNYLTKIHTLFQDHNMHKLLTHKPRNATAHDARTLIHYMYSLLKT